MTILPPDGYRICAPSRATRWALAAVAALLVQVAANDAAAQSFYSGQCGIPMSRFNEALLAEGQRTVIQGGSAGFRSNPNSPTGIDSRGFAQGITSTEDGRLGYHYEGNMPLGTPSTEVCVNAVLTNVWLSDARRAEIPDRAYLGGAFNDSVRLSAQNGTYPMLIAETVLGRAGNLTYGTPLVVFGNLRTNMGSVATLPEIGEARGQAATLALLNPIQYTQVGLDRLDKRLAAEEQQATGQR